MKKVTIYIQLEQWNQLDKIQKDIGISKSEFIRRCIETGIRYATIPNLDIETIKIDNRCQLLRSKEAEFV